MIECAGEIVERDLQHRPALESTKPVEAALGLPPLERHRRLVNEPLPVLLRGETGSVGPLRNNRYFVRHMSKHIANDSTASQRLREKSKPGGVVPQRAERVDSLLQRLAQTQEGKQTFVRHGRRGEESKHRR